MSDFVYLGPSLPRAAAQAILPAVYLDPVAMGDLYTLVKTRAQPGDRVAIIDGLFEQVPAVWHKEILFAIEQGIVVYGASSMGALRAAELHLFGMRGVGRIFAAYRDLLIEDDDEVAVAHATAEDGHRSLSTAMISIRFGLDSLLEAGVIDGAQHASLCAHAKLRHFSERSWADTYAHAKHIGLGDSVLQALLALSEAPDAKAQDAAALLHLLADRQCEAAPAAPAAFVLEQTGLWRDLVQSQQARVAGAALAAAMPGAPIDAELLDHVRAASPRRDALLRQALLMKTAVEGGATPAPSTADIKAAMGRIASANGVSTSADLHAWRVRQGLGDAAWKSLLDMEARVHQLALRAIPGLDGYLLAALKARGEYADGLDQLTAIRARHGDNWLKQLSAQDAGVDYAQLQRWYVQRYGPMLPDPESFARGLGFASLAQFVTHILGRFLLEEEGADKDAG